MYKFVVTSSYCDHNILLIIQQLVRNCFKIQNHIFQTGLWLLLFIKLSPFLKCIYKVQLFLWIMKFNVAMQPFNILFIICLMAHTFSYKKFYKVVMNPTKKFFNILIILSLTTNRPILTHRQPDKCLVRPWIPSGDSQFWVGRL